MRRFTPGKDEPDRSLGSILLGVKERHGRGAGSRLLQIALDAVETERARLVTLGGHNEGHAVMGTARRAYERYGFVL